ncbi:MgtC/SapB family protein [Synergistaceae bacterium OttesenSCG-928-D05]|nr:MgtC/SapB family protein [Synergistaceae bacterium OttesenSCG-928-D05]
MTPMFISSNQILLRVALATLCGLVFGLERKRSLKPVGARTHILVCLAACTIAIISAYGFTDIYHTYPENVSVRTDPARLVVGLLTGIGFIGAGIIVKTASGAVQGVTTAAEIFLVSVLGIVIGLGHFPLAGLVSVIAIITLQSERIHFRARQKKAERKSRDKETE